MGAAIRRAARAIVLKSVALVLEFGGHLPEPDDSRALAATAERQVAAPPYRAVLRAALGAVAVISISAAILVAPVWMARRLFGVDNPPSN